jgi:membrane fusion protein, multidrug efflux system
MRGIKWMRFGAGGGAGGSACESGFFRSFKASCWVLALAAMALAAQPAELAQVTAKRIERNVDLPGEFLPYEKVVLHARVSGYVERVLVDRGSVVKRGDLLVELTAPEMTAQIAEARSRVETAEAERAQAEAQAAAAVSTWERLKKAAETPGAVAGNEVIQAEKQVEAARALADSRAQAKRAAEAAARAIEEMAGYLRVTAPFAGVITDRLVHPGALVKADSEPALLVLQQVSRLRLVVAVPEQYVGGIARGARVGFRVPAFPGRAYWGTTARIAQALDEHTRTMAVELDVNNGDGTLAPGMYPTVSWPVRSAGTVLMVPRTSVVTTTERTFVIRVRDGRAEWVDVRKGPASGDIVEVTGPLKPGDRVMRRATDEIREGAPIGGR